MKVTLHLVIILSTTIAAAVAAINVDEQLERDEIIEAVNAAGSTWKAGRNFEPSMKKNFLNTLVDVKRHRRERPSSRYAPEADSLELEALPTTFDARDEWSQCITISDVMDQGPCYSAYVLAPTMVFQDRLCIATNGTFNTYLSVQQTLTCCEYCYEDYGCWGGWNDYVWDYLLNTGTCTGGTYKSKVGCQPYTIPECYHDELTSSSTGSDSLKNCSTFGSYGIVDTPACKSTCYNKKYTDNSFDDDFHTHSLKNCSTFGSYGIVDTPACKSTCYNKKYTDNSFDDDFHTLSNTFTVDSTVKQIQKELYKNGPLEAYFDVYEDFLSYKSGVYQHVTGDLYGSQVVRLLGWGVENGTKYWLAANSWNTAWGDGGLFKIKRGVNECEFEGTVMGGTPNVDGFF